MKALPIAFWAVGLASALTLPLSLVACATKIASTLVLLAMGTGAPDFAARGPEGGLVVLADFHGETVLLEWADPQCLP